MAGKLHEYDTLSDNQIRVVTATSKDFKSWSIRTISLDQDQTFNAVSYTWGLPTLGPSPLVTVEGCIVEAGANAVDALLSATRQEPEVPVWIDAVCINQKDKEEEAKQIPLMGKVYSQAKSVLIILPVPAGPAPWHAMFPGSPVSQLELSSIVQDMSELDTGGKKSHLQIERPLHVSTIRSSFLVNDLLTQRWWNRLWTFQEYVLAKNPVFVYGDSRIETETLVQYVRLYKDLNLGEGEAVLTPAAFRERFLPADHAIQDQPGGEEQDATTILLSLEEHRQRLIRDKDVTDSDAMFDADMDVLISTFRRDASEPWDKIFGLLGVLRSDELRGMHGLIGRTVEEVFTSVGYRILNSNTTGPRRFSLLHYIDTTTKLDSIPSWVPNFGSRCCAILLDPQQRSGTYLYNASASMPAASVRVSGSDFSSTAIFQLRAVVSDEVFDMVDEVTYLWNLCPHPRRFTSAFAQLFFEERCRDHVASVARRVSSRNQIDNLALAYCETLVAGSRRQGIATSSRSYIRWSPPLEVYRMWRKRLKTMADPKYDALHMGMNPGSYTTIPTSDPASISRAHKVGDEAFEFHQRFFEACAGRVFFSTAKGRLGIGPSSMVKGDLVVVMCGATTPFVMRKVDACSGVPEGEAPTENSTFRIIGEAYVHGLMDGEAFADLEKGEEVPWITLC
jgi:hypothetical protein